MTDGDDEYEVEDFRKLLRLKDRYDLIITFRYRKIYSSTRIFVSWVYNSLLRFLFRTPFRDSRRGCAWSACRPDDLQLESTSPFVGAELAIKTMLKGYRSARWASRLFLGPLAGQLDLDPEHRGHHRRHVADLSPRLLGRYDLPRAPRS